jgi:hypothetical protein
MRLDNLSHNMLREIQGGNKETLKKALKEELECTKEELIVFPLEKIEELRGKAKALQLIIDLLER